MNENVEKIKKLIKDKNLVGQIIISIDGPCGGGKTTIADIIEKNLDLTFCIWMIFICHLIKETKTG